MKNYQRNHPQFSLCGLNCALCPMHLGGYCPGCGGGEGNQPCRFMKCGREHGEIEFCFQCGEYPCEKYDGATDFDSFIPHKTMFQNAERAKTVGVSAYLCELDEKSAILRTLLENYNDGRRKTFFCIAVNLLELSELKSVIEQLTAEVGPDIPVKEKAVLAVSRFQAAAQARGIVLKLNKKPKKQP